MRRWQIRFNDRSVKLIDRPDDETEADVWQWLHHHTCHNLLGISGLKPVSKPTGEST